MKLEDYPTPITNADFPSLKSHPDNAGVWVEIGKLRDLERRLAACREALEGLLQDNIDRAWGVSGSFTTAMETAQETLTLTKP